MKLVLFDCDGTIVDSQHVIVAAMEHAFLVARLKAPARADILSVVGLSLAPAIARLLPPGTAPDAAMDLAEVYKGAFQELRRDPANHEPLYPGAREVITALAARPDVVLGVATGKSRRGVDVLFAREGLASLFQTIQTADDHPSKPHPSMIHKALNETGVLASCAVMIGDTTYDVEMARAAGVVPIGVTWGYHEASALEAAGAWTVLEDYANMPQAIETALAGQTWPTSGATP
jgi:phosphoglycolate phosphatase